jgi:hypothetical protein
MPDFSVVLFLSAENSTELIGSFERRLSELGVKSDGDAVASLNHWVDANERAVSRPPLIIFDGHFEPIARRFLPNSTSARVLITAQVEWQPTDFTLRIDVLPERDSVRLMCKIAPLACETDTERVHSTFVARSLGYLTLALCHAAHFVRASPGLGFQQYLKLSDVLLANGSTVDHERTSAETFCKRLLSASTDDKLQTGLSARTVRTRLSSGTSAPTESICARNIITSDA